MSIKAPPPPADSPPAKAPATDQDELQALIEEARRRARRRRARYVVLAASAAVLSVGVLTVSEDRSGGQRSHPQSGLAMGAAGGSCASHISIRYVSQMAGTFHYASVYALRNTGTNRCTLTGYPTLKVYRSTAGKPLATPFTAVTVKHTDIPPWGKRPTPVTLNPGASAGLIIGYVADPEARTCNVVSAFQIIIPHARSPITAPKTSFNVCPSRSLGRDLYISPVLPKPQPVPER